MQEILQKTAANWARVGSLDSELSLPTFAFAEECV
jgi:hypothetical protein